MAAKRMNITLPEDVAQALLENASEGERAAFIAKSIRYYVRALQRRALTRALKEGYLATRTESETISKEFEVAVKDGIENED